ncbi:MAG: hypothetical protein JWQ00_541 [Noviherbaspirillum sp.]|nr:hypothetical protein [Noviherbaspirillum sp.]
MTEKPEWEVLDAPSPGAQSRGARQSLPQLLKAMFGPRWKWKIAAVAVVAGLALAILLAVAGIVVITVTAVALVSIGVATVRSWLSGNKAGKHNVSVPPR